MKILFHTTAGERKPGEKIWLKGYRRPWVIMGEDKGLVKARHSLTGCIIWLSPGWKCQYENKEMEQTLGLSSPCPLQRGKKAETTGLSN